MRATAPWFSTSQCGVALVLDEEELAPVRARRLHTKHHQVGAGEEPQVGRQQELGQGALITGGRCAGGGSASLITADKCSSECFLQALHLTYSKLNQGNWTSFCDHEDVSLLIHEAS